MNTRAYLLKISFVYSINKLVISGIITSISVISISSELKTAQIGNIINKRQNFGNMLGR